MRHAKRINHLGRTSSHRAAMLSNMATSLIKHKKIATTLAKAKELRIYVEPLVTRSKNDTTHSRRVVFSYLQDKYAVTELFREISQKIADRPGGYTRILKTGFRKGDNAEMCIIEFVDYNETYTLTETKQKSTKTRRGGRGRGTTAAKEALPATDKETVAIADETIPETTTDEVVTEEITTEVVTEEVAPETIIEEVSQEEK